MSKLLTAFIFISLLISVNAQQMDGFRHFTTADDGLASDLIYSIMQDSKGYLWLSTNNGLSRYDGYGFRNFTVKDGLINNLVMMCAEDSTGRIWILQDPTVLCYYQDEKVYPFRYNDSIGAAGFGNNDGVRSFLVDGDKLYIGYDAAGCFYIDTAGNWGSFKKPPGLTVKQFSSGRLQYGNWSDDSKDGAVYVNKSVYAFPYVGIPFLNRAYHVGEKIFISSGQQLFSVHDDSLKPELNDRNITGMIRDKEGKIWISYGANGISSFMYDDDGFREISHELSAVMGLCLIMDVEGGIWVSSANGLYYKSPNRHMTAFSSTITDMSDQQVIDVLPVGKNEAYITYSNGELWRVDNNRNPVRYFRTKPLLNSNQLLVYDNDQKKIKTQTEIISFVEKEIKKTAIRKPPFDDPGFSFSFYAFSETQPDGTGGYWVSYFDGLLHIEDDRITEIITREDVVNNKEEILDFRPGPMLLDQRFRMFYHVLDMGLCELKNGKLYYLGDRHPLFRKYMGDIQHYNKDTVLLATNEAGLLVWAGDSIYTIDESKGLSSNVVNTIAVDETGIVWAGTDNGLNKIDLHAERPVVQVLTILQGLPSNKITEVKTRDHELWIGTFKGACLFDHTKIESNMVPPSIEFTGLRVFESDTAVKYDYAFPYDQNYLTFSYTGIAFKHQGAMTYEYRLEGLEEKWQSTGLRQIRYNSLLPGEYNFRVRAFNEDKTPSKLLSLPFTILPPYWQTWWFRTSAGLTLMLLLTLLFRWRLSQVRAKAATKHRMVELELKSLRAQMNPHFTFNSLISVQRFIMENDALSANDYLSDFAALIRRVLENSRENKITLENELQTLKMYLGLEKLRFKKSLQYDFDIAPDLSLGELLVPANLIQPYVENAIIHGILHRLEEDKDHTPRLTGFIGLVHIAVRRENKALLFVISDNGVGRRKAEEINARNAARRRSLGMEITRERMELLNSSKEHAVSVEVEDLYNDRGEPSGTRVEIRLPVEIIQ